VIWQTASLGDDITNTVADVAEALRYPVLILALLAGLWVLFELGRLAIEVGMRSQKKTAKFEEVARQAQATAQAGDIGGAQALLKSQGHSEQLDKAYIRTLLSPTPLDAERAAVDYDIYVSKRLDRVRLLTRAGPALGLMGTLIPLAPALAALGRGDAKVLTDELQTAFAITVIGVGIGLLAFAIALVHERFYSRDLANIDYLRQLRGDMAVVVQSTSPAVATTAVEVPATAVPVTPAPQAAPPSAPQTAPQTAPPSAPPAAQPASPPSAQPPAAPPLPGIAGGAAPAAATQAMPAAQPEEKKKKKFGLKRKEKAGDPVQPAGLAPLPPAPPAARPGTPSPGFPPPPQQAAPADKSPSIPTAPGQPGTPQSPQSPAGSDQGDDGDKSSSIPTPPGQ
jgi:biopolymer transport protein ExbB/TolQ